MPDTIIKKHNQRHAPFRPRPAAPLFSSTEWIRCGTVDSLRGGAFWAGKQRGRSDPGTDADFYVLGKCDWLDFLKRWERYGLEQTSRVAINC